MSCEANFSFHFEDCTKDENRLFDGVTLSCMVKRQQLACLHNNHTALLLKLGKQPSALRSSSKIILYPLSSILAALLLK